MAPDKSRIKLGSSGEKAALDFLTEKGYIIIETNYRAGRIGEIDIIAGEKEYICFIEVKTRTGFQYGSPSEAVGKRKQEKIIRTAECYISQKDLKDCNVRFDIVEIIMKKKNGSLIVDSLNLIQNAFY